MKKQDLSRRSFLKFGVAGLVAVPVAGLGWTTTAAAAERLDPESAEAQALQYVHKSEVDDQNCLNCLLYNDPSQEEWGPCAVFPGKVVAAEGWCTAWVARG
ncbi:high-potential iron-sulfur protein [Ectothiorhodospira sp. BSL-9]|uniref:high-potential iron-sulfur protein n=1 Tax=Ectothiorhodospira sp. BSL-9 TaxID=1442136 RepID=UPI0007B42FDD|nr:high-potential iron-sulfur protein [Ectothiorhodospira sp. BSL-9]ANB01092.1 High potential iron-sulfur protein [Ectothiorhodospira sp. BSL-9]